MEDNKEGSGSGSGSGSVEAVLYEGGYFENFTSRKKMNYKGDNIQKHALKLPLDMTFLVLMDHVKQLGTEVGLDMDRPFLVNYKCPKRLFGPHAKDVNYFPLSVQRVTAGPGYTRVELSDTFMDYVTTQLDLGKPLELYLQF